MATITQELNHQRKAHRITIPIMISIDHATFNVLDWSTTGLRIEDRDDILANSLKLNDEIKAMLILPTGKSSVVLELTIVLRNLKNLGCEITEMEEKNRRVLRHYATMSIEGNGQRIEDLMSDITMANVQTPIKDSIALTEDESKEIHMSFIKKVIFYGVAGLLLFITVMATFMYNYAVVYHEPGLSTGNSETYMASKKGKITDLYIEKGSPVTPGMLLYQINNEDENYALKVEYERLSSLKHKLEKNNEILKKYRSDYSKVKRGSSRFHGQDAIDYELEYDAQLKSYERAKTLYEKRLITLSHFNDATEKFQLFMKKYNKGTSTLTDIGSQNISLAEYEENVLALENNSYGISKSIKRSELKITNLKRRLDEYLGVAKHTGTVHSIKHRKGDYVDYGDKILVVETDEKPYILTKMMSYDAVNISIGQECIVYSKNEERKYKGVVTGIGYSATDTQTKTTTEISQNEIPVRIELIDDDVRFHLNYRVDIWIMRKSEFLRPVYDKLLWN